MKELRVLFCVNSALYKHEIEAIETHAPRLYRSLEGGLNSVMMPAIDKVRTDGFDLVVFFNESSSRGVSIPLNAVFIGQERGRKGLDTLLVTGNGGSRDYSVWSMCHYAVTGCGNIPKACYCFRRAGGRKISIRRYLYFAGDAFTSIDWRVLQDRFVFSGDRE